MMCSEMAWHEENYVNLKLRRTTDLRAHTSQHGEEGENWSGIVTASVGRRMAAIRKEKERARRRRKDKEG